MSSVKPTPVLTTPHTQTNHLSVLIANVHKQSQSRRETLPLAHNWAMITQDEWVSQASQPHQARQSLQISYSLEEQTKISQEVRELLAKKVP